MRQTGFVQNLVGHMSRMAGGSKRFGVESRGDVEATILQPYQSDISFCPTSHVDRSRLIKRRPFFKDRRRANSRIFGVRRASPLWIDETKAAMSAALQRPNPRHAVRRIISAVVGSKTSAQPIGSENDFGV